MQEGWHCAVRCACPVHLGAQGAAEASVQWGQVRIIHHGGADIEQRHRVTDHLGEGLLGIVNDQRHVGDLLPEGVLAKAVALAEVEPVIRGDDDQGVVGKA